MMQTTQNRNESPESTKPDESSASLHFIIFALVMSLLMLSSAFFLGTVI